MDKIRKNIIKRAAKLYAANLILNQMGNGTVAENISENESQLFNEEMERIAYRLTDYAYAVTIEDCVEMAIYENTKK